MNQLTHLFTLVLFPVSLFAICVYLTTTQHKTAAVCECCACCQMSHFFSLGRFVLTLNDRPDRSNVAIVCVLYEFLISIVSHILGTCIKYLSIIFHLIDEHIY